MWRSYDSLGSTIPAASCSIASNRGGGLACRPDVSRGAALYWARGWPHDQHLRLRREQRPTQLPSLAARIVASRPSVVVAMGPASARAIKAASASLPIVALTSFPVEAGLAASL